MKTDGLLITHFQVSFTSMLLCKFAVSAYCVEYVANNPENTGEALGPRFGFTVSQTRTDDTLDALRTQ